MCDGAATPAVGPTGGGGKLSIKFLIMFSERPLSDATRLLLPFHPFMWKSTRPL